MSLQKVVILGGSGSLGTFVLQELLAAGFTVTALTREGSSSTFPDGVAVKRVPGYDASEAIQAALTGQDALVSVIGTMGVGAQKAVADAAVAAGIKRFIPSEFGLNTRKLKGETIGKILAGKTGFVDYLGEKAKSNPSFSWTGLSTGLFFDFAIERGIAINHKDKSVKLVDSGNEKWQASTLTHIAKVVAGILKHPAKTANQYFETASFNVSQNEIIAIVEELTGTKYTVTKASSAELQSLGEEKLAKGDFSAFGPLLEAYNYGDGKNHALKAEDFVDSSVGVATDEDVKTVIKKSLVKAGVI